MDRLQERLDQVAAEIRAEHGEVGIVLAVHGGTPGSMSVGSIVGYTPAIAQALYRVLRTLPDDVVRAVFAAVMFDRRITEAHQEKPHTETVQ